MDARDASPDYRPLLKNAFLELRRARTQLEAADNARHEPIAIVGLGCRYPGGVADPESFWQLLRNGVDAITNVPIGRWEAEAYYSPDPAAPDKMYTRQGGFIDQVDGFDADFFGISPREAQDVDPQQRLLLEVAWEALENAGLAPDTLRGSRSGVFVGLSTDDYAHLYAGPAQDAYHILGVARSIAAGRLAYVLDLRGPVVQLDTACSSSLLTVHLACQSLRARECDLALAGGVNLMLTPAATIHLCKLRALSVDGRCKTFDAAADGYGRGEGCGLVVLKRLSDALAAGDEIVAVIRGSAVNHDGRSNGLAAPNGPAQEAVLRDALASAGVAPAAIQFVEAHGTGTVLGDPIEVNALSAVLGPGRSAAAPLLIGSVKSNFGHLEAAAGVAGLMKAALALQHGQLPPHLHFAAPNPYIAWDKLPVTVPTQLTDLPAPDGRRLAGVSAFGFSGTNVHVILESVPARPAETPSSASDRSLHLLTLSARNEAALRAAARRLSAYLDSPSGVALPLADVCHTANTGRAQFEHRLGVVGDSNKQLSEQLRRFADGQIGPGVTAAAPPGFCVHRPGRPASRHGARVVRNRAGLPRRARALRRRHARRSGPAAARPALPAGRSRRGEHAR